MRKSKIFGNKELEMIEKRSKGDRSDPTGLFSRKVKPKIIELLDWFKMKDKLINLIEKKVGRKK